MKKILSLLLAAALLLLTVLPVLAVSEYSYGCVIDYNVDDSGDEPALQDLDVLFYWGRGTRTFPKAWAA